MVLQEGGPSRAPEYREFAGEQAAVKNPMARSVVSREPFRKTASARPLLSKPGTRGSVLPGRPHRRPCLLMSEVSTLLGTEGAGLLRHDPRSDVLVCVAAGGGGLEGLVGQRLSATAVLWGGILAEAAPRYGPCHRQSEWNAGAGRTAGEHLTVEFTPGAGTLVAAEFLVEHGG